MSVIPEVAPGRENDPAEAVSLVPSPFWEASSSKERRLASDLLVREVDCDDAQTGCGDVNGAKATGRLPESRGLQSGQFKGDDMHHAKSARQKPNKAWKKIANSRTLRRAANAGVAESVLRRNLGRFNWGDGVNTTELADGKFA